MIISPAFDKEALHNAFKSEMLTVILLHSLRLSIIFGGPRLENVEEHYTTVF